MSLSFLQCFRTSLHWIICMWNCHIRLLLIINSSTLSNHLYSLLSFILMEIYALFSVSSCAGMKLMVGGASQSTLLLLKGLRLTEAAIFKYFLSHSDWPFYLPKVPDLKGQSISWIIKMKKWNVPKGKSKQIAVGIVVIPLLTLCSPFLTHHNSNHTHSKNVTCKDEMHSL